MCNKAIVAAHREEHQSCPFPVVLWNDGKTRAAHQSWVRCGGSYLGSLGSQNTTTSAGTAGPPFSGTRASCLPPRENISMRKGGGRV